MTAGLHRTLVEPYEATVMSTRPCFYVPMQGDGLRERVLGKAVTVSATAPTVCAGPFGGSAARRFSPSTSDNDSLIVPTNAAYHPGATFSVGGWINRLGAGDAASGVVVLHAGAGDVDVWYPAADNTHLSLRKAGTGECLTATGRAFGSPYDQGWVHVIFRRNASGADCYMDGVVQAGTYTNQTFAASSIDISFATSAASPTAYDFDGALAHWAIWPRFLTVGEIRELYTAGGHR